MSRDQAPTPEEMNQAVGDFRGALAKGSTAMVEERKTKAMSEVQSAMAVAQRFPRDEITAETKILKACDRYSLAEQAAYAYPRGKEIISGPSIRMAETLARHWGHLDLGFNELESYEDHSIVEAYCWDLEANVRHRKVFRVDHSLKLKGGGIKKLTDPRDRYENMANNGSRRLRACILAAIPGEVVEAAMGRCRETLKKGQGNVPLIDRLKKMVVQFSELGVTKEMLEKRLGHGIEICNLDELADLTAIFKGIRDGHSKREQWFDIGAPAEGGKAEKLQERLAPKKTEAAEPAPEPQDDAWPEGRE